MSYSSLKSYLKSKSYADFDKFQEGVFKYLNDNGTRLSVDPHDIVNMQAIRDSWTDIREVCASSGTINHEDRLKRVVVRTNYTDKLISFFQSVIFTNTNITAVELGGMGFPPELSASRGSIRLSATEVPEVTVTPFKGGVVKVKCKNNYGIQALPLGAKLMEVRYAFTNTEPTDETAYPNSAHFSRAAGELKFNRRKDGAFAYIIVRWCGGDNNNSTFSDPIPVGIMS